MCLKIYEEIEKTENFDQKSNSEKQNCVIDFFARYTLSTLDVIAETAMGENINAQDNPGQPYVTEIYKATELLLERILRFYLWPVFGFKFFGGQKFRDWVKGCKIMKDFTMNIISNRIENRRQEKQEEDGTKKQLAFLDLLRGVRSENLRF